MGIKWLAIKEATQTTVAPFVQGAVSLIGGWRALAFLGFALFFGATSWHYHAKSDRLALALQTSEVARAASIVIWKGEIDRLTASLADAKTAGDEAIKAKAQAEKDAAKKLAATNKRWKDKYAHDPVAKKWADEPLPAGVADGLREHP